MAQIERARAKEKEARHIGGYKRHPVAPGEFDAWLNEQDWDWGVRADYLDNPQQTRMPNTRAANFLQRPDCTEIQHW